MSDVQRVRQAVADFRAQYAGVENLWTVGESNGCDLLDELVDTCEALASQLDAAEAQRQAEISEYIDKVAQLERQLAEATKAMSVGTILLRELEKALNESQQLVDGEIMRQQFLHTEIGELKQRLAEVSKELEELKANQHD